MPTYQYVCQHCGHEFEAFQRMTEEPLKKCPSCKKLKLTRIISGGAGIIFKGSGFYETDYKASKKEGGESSSGDSSADSATSDKKETKPAEKPAAPKAAAKSGSDG